MAESWTCSTNSRYSSSVSYSRVTRPGLGVRVFSIAFQESNQYGLLSRFSRRHSRMGPLACARSGQGESVRCGLRAVVEVFALANRHHQTEASPRSENLD